MKDAKHAASVERSFASLDQFRRFRRPVRSRLPCHRGDHGVQKQHHLREAAMRQSQASPRFFPQYCPSRMRCGSLPVAPAGTNMGRMTHRFLASYGLSLTPKITKRTQGRPSRLPKVCARGGGMTTAFLLVTAAAQPMTKITKRTQGRPSWCAQGVCPKRRDDHRFFARDGPPLNRCQKLRNEPKASSPGAPQATKAELIGLRNLRNCSNVFA
jgi:hypothetical protein